MLNNVFVIWRMTVIIFRWMEVMDGTLHHARSSWGDLHRPFLSGYTSINWNIVTIIIYHFILSAL